MSGFCVGCSYSIYILHKFIEQIKRETCLFYQNRKINQIHESIEKNPIYQYETAIYERCWKIVDLR